EPAPCAAAADFPLIAFPGADAGVLADRLAKMGRVFRIDQKLIVGTDGICAPDLRSVIDVVSCDVTLHAELAARNADNYLVLDDHWCAGARFTLCGIAIHHTPLDLARLGVECHEGRISLMQEERSIS